MIKRLGGLLTVILLLITFVPATQAQAQVYCYGAALPRLQIGGQGRVTPGLPNSSNSFRSQPYRGYDSVVLGEIQAGAVFNVLGGPNCFDGMYWWQVSYNGQIGWTPEAAGYSNLYWTEPYSNVDYNCNLPTRLTTGQQGRVLRGLPNALRSQPSTGGSSVVLAWMPAGSLFSVLPDSECINGLGWRKVSYYGTVGWTPESQGSTYWVEPYGVIIYPPTPQQTCLPTPNLLSGYTGMVRTGLPNRLRSQPSQNSSILATMAAIDTFIVIQGPVCAQGINWWQVNYRGVIGWTAEGQNGQYWLDLVMCPGFQPSWISAGRYATVTPGLPNRLRANATTSSQILALIPAGATISVISGPACAENAAWWQVNYHGVIGWTMEGQGDNVWLALVN